uniref:flagellin lysine-N-methylase n=1 Tax=Eubacterium cellulosolvens TaxID=29322 RepID=UPI000481E3C4|nr:flagellin lysine-N-methylase [[Eubacterium] cellulosolvens]
MGDEVRLRTLSVTVATENERMDGSMIYEYPDWVEDFVCIADECEDTCCAGWEVDIDEGTLELYRSAEGSFGDRLRCEIRSENETEDGGCFFPLTKEGRCPFLNDRNLCDIITNLGPDAISMVCDEYPRYFVTVGDYEQMDMSLSCMELGRLFFAGEKMELRREEDAIRREEDDVDEERLRRILACRDRAIAALQDRPSDARPGSWRKIIEEAVRDWTGTDDDSKGIVDQKDREELEVLFAESDAEIHRRMTELEPLDASWPRLLADVNATINLSERMGVKASAGTGAGCTGEGDGVALQGMEPKCSVRTAAYEEQWNRWFTRLSVYFLFRYTIDAYYDGTVVNAVRMMCRSLRFIERMAETRERQKGTPLTVEDMVDLAHIYSRQVEHSEENVDALKTR